MDLFEFIQQAHPATLDWIENDLMAKLQRVDRLNKLQGATRELRQTLETATKS